jgi:hypothetical protein
MFTAATMVGRVGNAPAGVSRSHRKRIYERSIELFNNATGSIIPIALPPKWRAIAKAGAPGFKGKLRGI